MIAPRPLTHALVRQVSRSLSACELQHLSREAIDFGRAVRQHTGYVRALEAAGLEVRVLLEEPELPDSTFVEDTALLLDELTIITRLGAASRAREAELLLRDVALRRPLCRIEAPGSLEGGDVLRVGRTLFIGLSNRTNRAGLEQVRRFVEPYGYKVVAVAVAGCLHLKTGVTAPAAGLLLANPAWIDVLAFGEFEILPVPAGEPWGANTLPVNGRVLVAASAPRTADLLRARGLDVHAIDVSELQKAEAGLTCLSLLYSGADVAPNYQVSVRNGDAGSPAPL